MDNEVRATGLDPARERAIGDHGPQSPRFGVRPTRGVVVSASASRSASQTALGWVGSSMVRPMPRSISAPIIAGFWSRARRMTASAWSTRFRASSASVKASQHSGRLSDAAIVARHRRASKICREQDAQSRRHADTADRDRGLPLGLQRRGFSDAIVRQQVGIDLDDGGSRDRGASCGDRLHAARSMPHADGAILFDIGGGSSELVRLGRLAVSDQAWSAASPDMRGWISLPVGVVTLAERHGGIVVTREIFEAMISGGGRSASSTALPLRAKPHESAAHGICSAPPAR